jgi:hypothetical protein
MRRDDFPVDVIERGSEIVDDISTDQRDFVYQDFVLFDREGPLAGLYVRSNNASKRTLFAQKFVEFSEVLRGAINLEQCAVCHGRA